MMYAVLRILVSACLLWLSATDTFATELMAEEPPAGDPQAGLEYAKQVCANCHGITNASSPVPEALAFTEIANETGMSANALIVWMDTRHPTMPDVTVEKEDLLDVIAYILSHKDEN